VLLFVGQCGVGWGQGFDAFCGSIAVALVGRMRGKPLSSGRLKPHRTKENQMKKFMLAAAFATAASTAFAGGVAEPTMEPEVVAAKTATSAGGIVIPLLLLLVVAAAVSSNGSSY
jgi:hypothetical protein